MLGDQRALFSLPEGLHYLNCASRGPLPTATQDAGRAAFERQVVPHALAPDEYFARSERLRGNLAGLVGTSPDRIAITPAVSYGVAIATHNWRIPKGHAVVVPEEEFPSDVYGWIAACQKAGGVLRSVARPKSRRDIAARWSEAIVDAIDHTTAVVNLSTVHWTDGLEFDIDAVARRAREVDALFVLDATQSLGALGLDYDHIQPDLLLCSGYKWLFGPYQIGFAVLGDKLIDAEPFEHHWSNRAGSEDVSGTQYRHEFRDGARRFDVGEHSNDITVSMLDASVDLVRSLGVDSVQSYCRALTAPLESYLASSPYTTAGEGEHCGHILGMRADRPGLLDRAMGQFAERNIRLSRRGDSLRISPHMYNTAEDIGLLIEALSKAAGD